MSEVDAEIEAEVDVEDALAHGLGARDLQLRAGARRLLDTARLALRAGRLTAILGPNGAGKSTLLSVLAGARRPHVGQAVLDGRSVAAQPAAQLALRRALMPQESSVAFEFTAWEVVALGRYPHRRDAHEAAQQDSIVAQAMACTDVEHLAGRVLNSLSGGERARVHMARVLAQLWHPRPDAASRWLLLDEPTAALDLSHQHRAMRLLRDWAAGGCGVAAVLHDLNLARRYADEVIVMDGEGSAITGATAEVLTPALIERVWRTPCQQVTDREGVPQFLFA